MPLTKEERERLTLKALQLQKKSRQRKSVLEPYKEWIREMIEQRDMTFRILTHVLHTECGIKITEQSLNEWYRRHIGRPPRSRATGKRTSRTETPVEELKELQSARGRGNVATPSKEAPAPAPPRKRLDYNSPDAWSL